MAKVEIEERAFNEPALRIASSKHKVPVAYILGCIAIVWRASQQIGVVKATGEEILAWLDTDRFIKPEVALRWLISADLIRSEEPFLESSNNNLKEISFFISGNPVAVARTKKRIENARVAANSRYHKEQSCETHAARMPYNTTSIQVDKKTVKQEDKKETKTVSSELVFETKKPASLKNNQPTDGSLIWNAYSAAYRQRYGIEPKRNATTSAQCSQLVKRLGVKDAIEVVRFYLSHGKSWYVQNSHAIGNCLKDAEALYTQMRTNVRVTASQANEIDRGVTQAEMFERVTKEMVEKYDGVKK
jgi:hypothetical protein